MFQRTETMSGGSKFDRHATRWPLVIVAAGILLSVAWMAFLIWFPLSFVTLF
jgi:hypothetical protein